MLRATSGSHFSTVSFTSSSLEKRSPAENSFGELIILLVGALVACSAESLAERTQVKKPQSSQAIACKKVGSTFPVPGDCGSYAECSKAKILEIKPCPAGQRYDTERKSCVGVECIEFDTAPVAGKCKQYKYCKKAQWKVASCYFWHKYDPIQKKCRGGYDCKATPQCDNDGEVAPTKANDCMVFLQCHNHTWVPTQCPKGAFFDVKSSKCDSSVKCECKAGDTRAVKGQCKNFEKCAEGKFVPAKCPWLKTYDPKKKMCIWSLRTKC
ncbi:hypothetical protein AAG570_011055 [Ranatra chinensis]|uniref:Chitin-binding type-2 domain-containing protein n=1 Tax=Ranatra chinensis TaxID=642074 RepID=A0ABD0Z5T0_9HEMI